MKIVFIVGPRGSGKTLVSNLLGRDYGCRVCDTDALIREKTGKSVTQIVEEGGWPAYRVLESEALAEAVAFMRASGEERAVVATGGGIVLDTANRARMRSEGAVAYLSAPAAVLMKRLAPPAEDPSRPSLTGLPPEQEMIAVLRERVPLYREVAHHVIDADMPPERVVATLYECVFGPCGGKGADV